MSEQGTLVCRFCGFVIRSVSGRPPWYKMKGHIYDAHRAEFNKIQEHKLSRKAPESLTDKGPKTSSRGKASIGAEFRKRLGYSSAAPGAEQSGPKEPEEKED